LCRHFDRRVETAFLNPVTSNLDAADRFQFWAFRLAPDEGLITEVDYEKKKKTILNDL
tara:strand:+ start:894 stop:1067 length:174 start_codon:yes stop_codon:yes gene_type:complete